MKPRLCPLLGASLSFLAATAIAATMPPAPDTPKGDAADVIQGVRVADPYRWLENWDDAKVQAWSDAQNDRTRAYLDALPGRDAIKAELTRLITATSPQFYGLQARDTRVFALYFDPKFQQPMLVVLNAAADPGSSMTVLDPNKLDASGHTAIDWYAASPDGTRVAVSLSLNGSEDGTLHVYEVASAKEIDAPIPRVQYPTAGGSVAWTADSKAFWYTRYPGDDAPEADRHFFQQTYFHRDRRRRGRRSDGARHQGRRPAHRRDLPRQHVRPCRRAGVGAARRRRRMAALGAEGRRRIRAGREV